MCVHVHAYAGTGIYEVVGLQRRSWARGIESRSLRRTRHTHTHARTHTHTHTHTYTHQHTHTHTQVMREHIYGKTPALVGLGPVDTLPLASMLRCDEKNLAPPPPTPAYFTDPTMGA